jgi:hypothetical protein
MIRKVFVVHCDGITDAFHVEGSRCPCSVRVEKGVIDIDRPEDFLPVGWTQDKNDPDVHYCPTHTFRRQAAAVGSFAGTIRQIFEMEVDQLQAENDKVMSEENPHQESGR